MKYLENNKKPMMGLVMNQNYSFRPLQLLCIFIMLTMSNMANSATPADIEAAQRQAELIQKQEQQRLESERDQLRRRNERVDGMDTDSLVPKISVPNIGAPCRDIDVITISNSPSMSDSFREAIDAKYAGRCLNVGHIEGLLGEITKYYIDSGYVTTRAYLAPQDLTKGYLTILVIEGVIQKIEVQDSGANSVSPNNIFPASDGELLNLRDLEQGIDQINRLASNNARLDIQPGEAP